MSIILLHAGRQAGKQAKNLILLHVETIMYYAVNWSYTQTIVSIERIMFTAIGVVALW